MRSLFVIALSCFLAACAQQQHAQLYSGSPLPESQVLSVVIPHELEVQSINGQPASGANSMFGTSDKTLHLQPGEYRISAFYKQGFDINGGMSHEIVRGRTAVFAIDGQAGEQWRVEFERPSNLQEAKELETEFNAWTVNTRTGDRVASEPGQRNNSLVNMLLGTAGVSADDAAVAPLGAMTEASAAPVAPARPAPAPVAGQALPHNDATLSTLQQLWQLLGEDSRAAFLDWAAQ